MSFFPGPQPGGGTGGSSSTAGVVLGSDSLESAGNAITIDMSASPITDSQYVRLNFEFEVDGACEVRLLLNGETDPTGYYVDGSANVATISTLPGDAAQRGGGIYITPSASSGGNLVCFGVADIWNPTSTIGDASLKWFRTLTGLTGITQIQLRTSANNFKAGSSASLTQTSGVGPKGDTGATGPAGADGAGAITPSYARYTGVAARGSTNTYNWRFSTMQEESGSDLTYVASSTLGDSFTVNTSGVYAIAVGGYGNVACELLLHVGAAIANSVAFSATTMRKAGVMPAGTYTEGLNWVGYIPSGHKIWVASGSAPFNSDPLVNSISIARVN